MRESQPYQTLGTKLKRLREKCQESLAEVAGSLEIDIDTLSDIEQGAKRPSEDTLLMLITHFSIKEDEATSLWEMAGFDRGKQGPATGGDITQPYVMVMPMDARIVYSDLVHVMVNNYGVVLNFMQGSAPNNQPLAVARVGMSVEHAQSVLKVLKETLDQHARQHPPKLLKEDNQNQKKQD